MALLISVVKPVSRR